VPTAAGRTAASVTPDECYKLAKWQARHLNYGSETEAEDLVSEGVAAIVRALRDFRPGSGMNVISWALLYAHNAMISYLAKTQRKYPDPYRVTSPRVEDPSSVFDDTTLRQRLSPLANLALTTTLHAARKLNYAEMGEHLGVPPKVVKGVYAEVRAEVGRLAL